MKNLVFFFIVFSFIFFSCAGTINLKQEKMVGVFSEALMDEFSLGSEIKNRQFVLDTTQELVLAPVVDIIRTSSLNEDGSTVLVSEPVTKISFPAGTYGTVKDVLVDKKTKTITGLNLYFDKDQPDKFLTFGPANDEVGTYILYANQDNTVTYGKQKYKIEEGSNLQLYLVYLYAEGQPSVYTVKGVKVKQKK
jgi:hypothetical protein